MASPRIDSAQDCTGRAQPGTKKLLDTVMAKFGGAKSGGIYNCRPVRGSDNLSVHAEGRAFDVNPVGQGQGDAIARWLVGNAKQYQIQRVIWWRKIWEAGKGWRDYKGVHPHEDHVHVEQNWCGAAGRDCPPILANGTAVQITLVAMVAAGAIWTFVRKRRKKQSRRK